jgi:hypothetical protein
VLFQKKKKKKLGSRPLASLLEEFYGPGQEGKRICVFLSLFVFFNLICSFNQVLM